MEVSKTHFTAWDTLPLRKIVPRLKQCQLYTCVPHETPQSAVTKYFKTITCPPLQLEANKYSNKPILRKHYKSVLSLKNGVFWDVTPCGVSLLSWYFFAACEAC
jgi:hypothetical protein